MADTKISALTAATTPLDGTEVLPIVQSGTTKKVANNDLRPKQIQSNATSGVMQIVGPAAAATRVMTIPDANFTVARTDAGQTFTGAQTFSTPIATGSGGTGLSSFTSGGIVYASSASVLTTGSALSFDGTSLQISSDTLSNLFVTNTTTSGATTGAGIGFKVYNGSSVAQNGSIFSTSSTWSYGTYSANQLSISANGSGGVRIATASAPVTIHTGDASNSGLSVKRFTFDSTGNAVVETAAKGINFTANTSAAGKTSQLLNWYEEGTWTPVISSTGTAPTISSYSNQNGYYTRIGNMMYVSCMIRATVTSAGTGDVTITGLPFTIKSGTYNGIAQGINNLFATKASFAYGNTNDTKVIFEGAVLATSTLAYITFQGTFPI